MTTALTVIIYDRTDNLRAWCRAWELSRARYPSVEFRVICNAPEKHAEYRREVESVGGVFIPRHNQGFDIGALQDIARRRLAGFKSYDYLLWCVDDLLPVHPDFLSVFLNAVTAPDILPVFEMSVKPVRHVRTTGVLMPHDLVEKLQFVADPITTKEHCYSFEHRDVSNHFLLQAERAGYQARQIAPIATSPLWDTGRSGTYLTPRKKGFASGWPEVYEAKYGRSGGTMVEIFATAFESYPILAHSLIAQSHKHWRLIIEHDGAPPQGYENLLPQDSRIVFRFSKERDGNHGHAKRARYVAGLADARADFVMITNHDNYYAPKFLENAVAAFEGDEGAIAVYCDCLHSYVAHKILPARTVRGFIDCGAAVFRRSEVAGVAWQSMEHSADWFWFDAIAKNRGGFRRWNKFDGVHFVHN